jgi:hypothetical protein
MSTKKLFLQKIFEGISLVLANSNGDGLEIYLNQIIEFIYTLAENSWRRYVYEVCRQVKQIYETGTFF